MDASTKQLVALGASVSANCVSCVRYHLDKARELGLSEQGIADALQVGRMVRRGAARKLDEVLRQRLEKDSGEGSGPGHDPSASTRTHKEKTND